MSAAVTFHQHEHVNENVQYQTYSDCLQSLYDTKPISSMELCSNSNNTETTSDNCINGSNTVKPENSLGALLSTTTELDTSLSAVFNTTELDTSCSAMLNTNELGMSHSVLPAHLNCSNSSSSDNCNVLHCNEIHIEDQESITLKKQYSQEIQSIGIIGEQHSQDKLNNNVFEDLLFQNASNTGIECMKDENAQASEQIIAEKCYVSNLLQQSAGKSESHLSSASWYMAERENCQQKVEQSLKVESLNNNKPTSVPFIKQLYNAPISETYEKPSSDMSIPNAFVKLDSLQTSPNVSLSKERSLLLAEVSRLIYLPYGVV